MTTKTKYNSDKVGISEFEKREQYIEICKQEYEKNIQEKEIIKEEKPKRYCKICGKELETKQTNYCSYECATKAITKRPSKEILQEALENNNFNLTNVGKLFNVSANAIKKWCVKYNIQSKSNNFIHRKKIGKYDLDMNLIITYDSISDALKENPQTIRKVLNGTKEFCNGYIWKYID